MPKGTVRKTLIEGGTAIRSFRRNHEPISNSPNVMRAGNTPFGYCYLDGKLVVDARERQTVLDMWRMWQGGHSFRSIARTLNEHKISTRFGKSWKHEVVKQILKRHEAEKGITNGIK